jgi:hypothetical protein
MVVVVALVVDRGVDQVVALVVDRDNLVVMVDHLTMAGGLHMVVVAEEEFYQE